MPDLKAEPQPSTITYLTGATMISNVLRGLIP